MKAHTLFHSHPPPPSSPILQVSEERLVSMLEQISEREGAAKPKITIQRRRPAWDEDD